MGNSGHRYFRDTGMGQKEVTISAQEWSAAAGNMLATAMKSDPLAGVAALENMVKAGEALLFGVFAGCYMVAAYVLRVDHKPHGDEGVIVAAAGKLKGFSLITSLLSHVEQQFKGCASIRVHTARPGMVRQLKKAGYMPREIILSKGL